MSNCVKEYTIIDKKIQDEINKLINEDITGKKLFNSAKELINVLSTMDNYYNFTLIDNDITYLKYSSNKQYSMNIVKYLNDKYNEIEEFTLLVCLDAKCIGGEIVLHLNDHLKYKSSTSITPYNALLFEKNVKYEELMLESGYKNIITLNLLAIKKDVDKLLIIKCKDNKEICIQMNNILNIPNNSLITFIDFKNKIDKNISIYIYNETEYTYEGMGIISKIFNKIDIPFEEYTKYKHIIDYYLIDVTKLDYIQTKQKIDIKQKHFNKTNYEPNNIIKYEYINVMPNYEVYNHVITEQNDINYYLEDPIDYNLKYITKLKKSMIGMYNKNIKKPELEIVDE